MLSTTGWFSASGLSGADEDVFACNSPIAEEPNAPCESLTLYLDGSAVGLSSGGEDVDGVALDSEDSIYMSSAGSFSVSGLSGADEDVFACSPDATGTYTSCALFFDGSLYGLGGNDLHAADLP